MPEYVDSKIRCLNPECSATFTMRLEHDTPFYCDECSQWQQAEFPCPLCGSETQAFLREENTWVVLQPSDHEHPEPTPESEPAAEPEAESEPATEEQAQ